MTTVDAECQKCGAVWAHVRGKSSHACPDPDCGGQVYCGYPDCTTDDDKNARPTKKAASHMIHYKDFDDCRLYYIACNDGAVWLGGWRDRAVAEAQHENAEAAEWDEDKINIAMPDALLDESGHVNAKLLHYAETQIAERRLGANGRLGDDFVSTSERTDGSIGLSDGRSDNEYCWTEDEVDSNLDTYARFADGEMR